MAAPHSTSSAKPDNDQICIYASFVEFQQVSGCINKFQVASTPEPNTTAISTFSKKAGQINMHARYLGQGHVKDVETVCMHWPYEHRSEWALAQPSHAPKRAWPLALPNRILSWSTLYTWNFSSRTSTIFMHDHACATSIQSQDTFKRKGRVAPAAMASTSQLMASTFQMVKRWRFMHEYNMLRESMGRCFAVMNEHMHRTMSSCIKSYLPQPAKEPFFDNCHCCTSAPCPSEHQGSPASSTNQCMDVGSDICLHAHWVYPTFKLPSNVF